MDEQEPRWETVGPDAVRCVSCGDVFAVAAGFQRGHVCHQPIVYGYLDVRVVDGYATLPDGRKIAVSGRTHLRIPWLDEENRVRMSATLPLDEPLDTYPAIDPERLARAIVARDYPSIWDYVGPEWTDGDPVPEEYVQAATEWDTEFNWHRDEGDSDRARAAAAIFVRRYEAD